MTTQNMIGRAYSTTPTATTIASWDANSNLSANNQLIGYATTATAAGTTTLTVSSPYQQFFTGATTQTVTMPVTSTLVLGQQWYIVNNSSGVVTVQSSGANTIIAMAANTVARITCILTSGTTAASWFAEYDQSSLTLPLSPSNGGTGVANSGNLTWGGSVTFSGAFTTTFTVTGNTSVTLPTSGTLATTAQIPTGAALTKTDDTNVTLTLGGSPSTALVNAASLTLGWTGTLGLTRGGTAASLTASNGGIVWSNASQLQILSGTATAGQILRSGASATPSWSTATYPATAGTSGNFLASDGTNFVSTTTLGTANGGTGVTASDPVIQRVSTLNVTSTTGTTTIPFDDTIPQNTEGDQYMTQAITPKNTANILVIEALLTFGSSTAANYNLAMALFQDSTANALACQYATYGISGGAIEVYLKYIMTAGTTSSTTFKIRAGAQGAGTTTTNGQGGNRKYGGVLTSYITITEYST